MQSTTGPGQSVITFGLLSIGRWLDLRLSFVRHKIAMDPTSKIRCSAAGFGSVALWGYQAEAGFRHMAGWIHMMGV